MIGFLFARIVTNPIKKLTQTVDEVTKGKLDIQLPKSNIKEVQSLTDSLNRILASLKLAILKTGSSAGELGLGEAVKAKEEIEEKYKILYETSRDAIMILESPNWNFAAGNPATIKMFRAKDEKDFISKGPGELSPEKQPDGKLSSDSAKVQIMKAMKTGSAFFNWTHKRISGKEFPATVLLTRFKLKGKDALQATVRDLSKHFVKKEIVKSTTKPLIKKTLPKPKIKTKNQKVIKPGPIERKSKKIIDEINKNRIEKHLNKSAISTKEEIRGFKE